jgi:hypothetical protein
MGLLGEMLVERGAISPEQLRAGLAACRRGGARLGTYLVDYGFIDERELLEALAEQHGVPYVPEQILMELIQTVEPEVLPRSMIRRLRVVPFRQVEDRLHVAMSSPGDARLIDRISNFTQLHVEPFVASDRTIERAIEKVKDLKPVMAAPPPPEELTEVLDDVAWRAPEWDDLWTSEIRPQALFRQHSRPRAASMVMVASFPSLEPAGAEGGKLRGAVTSNRELVQMLGTANTARDVGEMLVHYASQRLDRVCLFAVHHGKVSGWMSRGLPLDAADVRSFSIFGDVPSLFWELREADRYVGEVEPGPVNNDILQLFGQPPPTELLAVPLPMKGRTKGFLVGDLPSRGVPPAVQDELAAAGRAAGDALAAVLRGRV